MTRGAGGGGRGSKFHHRVHGEGRQGKNLSADARRFSADGGSHRAMSMHTRSVRLADVGDRFVRNGNLEQEAAETFVPSQTYCSASSAASCSNCLVNFEKKGNEGPSRPGFFGHAATGNDTNDADVIVVWIVLSRCAWFPSLPSGARAVSSIGTDEVSRLDSLARRRSTTPAS